MSAPGLFAHQIPNLLNTAILVFETLITLEGWPNNSDQFRWRRMNEISTRKTERTRVVSTEWVVELTL
jgi:hypothetical protein